MARGNSLYGKYLSAGKAKGGYTSSWYAQKGLEAEKGAESLLGDMRQRKLDETVGAIGEGITLASNIYEGYKSKKEMDRMVKPVGEGGLGAVEQKQSTLDWIFGAEKEYKLEGEGEKIYKASDVRAKFQTSLYDEATSNVDVSNLSEMKDPRPESQEKVATTDPMPSWQTPGGGLTKAANDKLYKADPSMHGKSKEDRTKRYKELFGEEQDVKEIENIPFQTKQMVRKHPMD
jgi:hypothetical protein